MSAAPSPYRTVIEAMFRIVDKSGVACDFRLNDVQARLDAGWTRRNIVPKARQEGVSSYIIARFVAKCLTEQNRTCVIISHEAEATTRLLGRAHYILENLKLPSDVKPVLGTNSQRAIVFKKTNSTIYIGTAGSRSFGHGDTITDLHLSEVSRYPDPESIVRGTFPAAEHGEITVESTGNGVGNWFHRQCVRAREGVGFTLHFFAWPDAPEYSIPFASEEARSHFLTGVQEDLGEPALLARGVSAEQLQWRRERLTIDYELDLHAFAEAYPFDFDECFQSKGFGFFRRVRFEETAAWTRESAQLHVLAPHPLPGHIYTIGADPAGGVGADNSVAQVFDLVAQCQVAEYASGTVEPPEFGEVLAQLGKRFNFAYINVERNNHGGTTLARLLDVYPVWLVHRGSRGEESTQHVLSHLSHYGTLTTASSRGIILGTARELLATEWTIHSPLLKSELATFIEKDGKAEADNGCKDDRVMATCMAAVVAERAGVIGSVGADWEQAYDSYERVKERDPFSFEALFGEQGREREMFGTPERFH
jgi:hypothetical protein